ncbi:MAG: hypothetical protein IKX51_06420 [Bacteroidales bacterium]|nr:hypothetical protein [Bacteroidales bacterium]
MKKTIVIAIALLTSLVSVAQKNLTIDEVHGRWQNTTLKSSDGKIISMVKAFNSMLPTYSVTEFLREAALPESKRNFIVEIDNRNEYVSFAEGSDDRSSESMSARVWRRSNGHKLFAMVFSQPSSLQQSFAVFYDYNPNKGTLTPEYDFLRYFKVSFYNSLFSINLPTEGNDLVVSEYFMNWWMGIRHIYRWEGDNLMWSESVVENMDTMELMYREGYYSDDKHPFEQYSLIDLDGDDEPELWLSSNNMENQAVFSISEGKIALLGGNDFKRNMFFYRNVVADAGGCGTGCFYVQYSILEKSVVKNLLTNMQSYNMKTDNLDDNFELNGKPIENSKAKSMVKAFGDMIEYSADWRPMKAMFK